MDDLLYGKMERLKEFAAENLRQVDEFIKVWTNHRNEYNQMIGKFQMQLGELEENIKSLIFEKTKAPSRAGFIEEIIIDCEKKKMTIKENIEKLKMSGNTGNPNRIFPVGEGFGFSIYSDQLGFELKK